MIHEVSDVTKRGQVDQLIKVGFSPLEAWALAELPWTVDNLITQGHFSPRQAGTLVRLAATLPEADLIRQGGFTRHQAELLNRFYA